MIMTGYANKGFYNFIIEFDKKIESRHPTRYRLSISLHTCLPNCYRRHPLPSLGLTHIIIIWARHFDILREM